MYNTLTTEQKQEVKAIGEADVQALRQITAELFPDSTYTTHLEFVHNIVAEYVEDDDDAVVCVDCYRHDCNTDVTDWDYTLASFVVHKDFFKPTNVTTQEQQPMSASYEQDIQNLYDETNIFSISHYKKEDILRSYAKTK